MLSCHVDCFELLSNRSVSKLFSSRPRKCVSPCHEVANFHLPCRLIFWTNQTNTGSTDLHRLAGPSTTEMLLHSTHIGNRCTQPTHKSQTTSHSVVSPPKFEKLPLAVSVHRGASPPFQQCTKRLVQSGVVSATGGTMETMDAKSRIQQLGTTDRMQWEEDQELVDSAIVWALQHGLVSRLILRASSPFAA